ncbi:hypothetical protein PIB30_097859, partial [Stylosanthes scabra]|nr:hypothetical protein [Stylosanthes scabra]
MDGGLAQGSFNASSFGCVNLGTSTTNITAEEISGHRGSSSHAYSAHPAIDSSTHFITAENAVVETVSDAFDIVGDPLDASVYFDDVQLHSDFVEEHNHDSSE